MKVNLKEPGRIRAWFVELSACFMCYLLFTYYTSRVSRRDLRRMMVLNKKTVPDPICVSLVTSLVTVYALKIVYVLRLTFNVPQS